FGIDAKRGPAAAKTSKRAVSSQAIPGTRRRLAAASGMMHGQSENSFFRQLGSRQFTNDGFIPHDIGAIANGNNLRQFGADHQNRCAFGDEIVDDCKYFRFGPDVDSPRWFVKNQKPRARVQPLSNHNLLLIAAAQVFHQTSWSWRSYAQFLNQI